jgi:hypothetical protein
MSAFAPPSLNLSDRVIIDDSKKLKNHRNLETRQCIHMKSVTRFFDKEDRVRTLVSIVNKQSAISLRLLEFVCTHMARCGLVLSRKDGTPLYLDALYKDRLESQGKSFFDPFRRNPKSRFVFHKFGMKVETNLAQLRFFQFAIKNGVIDYAKQNFRAVEEHMSEVSSQRKTPKKRKTTDPPRRLGAKKKKTKPRMRTDTVHMDFTPKSKRPQALINL